MNEKADPRSEAKWAAALNELVQCDLVAPQGYKGESFQVTHAGYDLADKLATSDAGGD